MCEYSKRSIFHFVTLSLCLFLSLCHTHMHTHMHPLCHTHRYTVLLKNRLDEEVHCCETLITVLPSWSINVVCKVEMAWIDIGRERKSRRERGEEREKEKERERLIDGSAVAVKMTDTGVNQGIFMANREGQLIDLDLWLGAWFIVSNLSILSISLSLSLSVTHTHTHISAFSQSHPHLSHLLSCHQSRTVSP